MKKNHLLTTFIIPFIGLLQILIISFSCSPVRETNSGITIKENTFIKVYNDKFLNNKSIISGYVYSRMDSCFLEGASILIDKDKKIGVITDEMGYFQYDSEPGIYSISCFYVGHRTSLTKEIKIENNQRVIIIFELGTDIIY